jgi:hypothetical protein
MITVSWQKEHSTVSSPGLGSKLRGAPQLGQSKEAVNGYYPGP